MSNFSDHLLSIQYLITLLIFSLLQTEYESRPLATSHKQMNGEGQQLETCNNEPHSGHNVRCPHSTFRPHNKKNTWINNCLDTTSIHFHRTFVQSLVNVNFWAESLIVLFLQIELFGIPRIFLCFVVCLSYYWSFCGTNWEDYVRPKISFKSFPAGSVCSRITSSPPYCSALLWHAHISMRGESGSFVVWSSHNIIEIKILSTVRLATTNDKDYCTDFVILEISVYFVPLDILAVVGVDEVVIRILVHFNFHHAVFTVVLKSGKQLSDGILRLLNTILYSDCCIVSAESGECFLTTSLQLYYSIITTTPGEKLFSVKFKF